MTGDTAVSASVITFNEEARIERCLKSLSWADEIVVVDSFSTDATVDVCRRFTDRIVQREFKGFKDQFNYAMNQTTHEWVVSLDADEAFTDEAVESIKRELEGYDGSWDAFSFPRRAWFIDRWIWHSGWYPQRKVRLFKKTMGQFDGEEPHIGVHTTGRVKDLEGDILHWPYPDGVHSLADRINRYSTIAAASRLSRGRRFSAVAMLAAPSATFIKKYLLKLGFLDGRPGLIISYCSAYYEFCKWAKMWDMQKRPPGDDLPYRAREAAKRNGERDSA